MRGNYLLPRPIFCWFLKQMKFYEIPVPATCNLFPNFRKTYFHLTQYCAGGKIENNDMGGECDTYGGGEMCAQGSDWET